MKTLLATLLYAASVLAPVKPVLAQAEAACGPPNVNFDAKTFDSLPAAGPERGKALVYVIEDFRRAPGELTNPTLRVGLDGAWVGATRASSYLYFSVNPGEHHLCTNWQSSLKRLSRLAAFSLFMAQAGRTYYFCARILYSPYGYGPANMNLNLELTRVNPDEGRYLVSSFRLSKSHPKK